MLELAWDGFIEHTHQGWNVGKPPYGYLADRVPHPVPARREQGAGKHRLTPDPVCGPVVTEIFRMRVLERLSYSRCSRLAPPEHRLRNLAARPEGVGEREARNRLVHGAGEDEADDTFLAQLRSPASPCAATEPLRSSAGAPLFCCRPPRRTSQA
jgi:hypothetical protein